MSNFQAHFRIHIKQQCLTYSSNYFLNIKGQQSILWDRHLLVPLLYAAQAMQRERKLPTSPLLGISPVWGCPQWAQKFLYLPLPSRHISNREKSSWRILLSSYPPNGLFPFSKLKKPTRITGAKKQWSVTGILGRLLLLSFSSSPFPRLPLGGRGREPSILLSSPKSPTA